MRSCAMARPSLRPERLGPQSSIWVALGSVDGVPWPSRSRSTMVAARRRSSRSSMPWRSRSASTRPTLQCTSGLIGRRCDNQPMSSSIRAKSTTSASNHFPLAAFGLIGLLWFGFRVHSGPRQCQCLGCIHVCMCAPPADSAVGPRRYT